MSNEEAKVLTRECLSGDRVFWDTVGGIRRFGVLMEWDSNVAVIQVTDGTGRKCAVEC